MFVLSYLSSYITLIVV